MRGLHVFAGGFVACAAVALAPPAHADQYEFISFLDNWG